MLSVTYPGGECSTEIRYVLDVVLRRFLGITYRECAASDDMSIIRIQQGGKSLSIVTKFFDDVKKAGWLSSETIPSLPLEEIDVAPYLGENELCLGRTPVLFGLPTITVQSTHISCALDIFGSIFFLLSRYEEAVLPERDQHDRFPAEASVGFRAGFLDRPLVNEYVEVLWSLLLRLWPRLRRSRHEFRMRLSHDVDVPFEDAFRSTYWSLRRFAGDALKRRDLALAASRFRRWRAVRRGNLELDSFNTFDFIMAESERRGLSSSFYFIPNGSDDQPIKYRAVDPIIQRLLTGIHDRGHEIGLHASYSTYLDGRRTRVEAELLQSALQRAHISQRVRGGRQHYLRWRTPSTARNWESAQLDYESTLGYPTRPGFRCGTCWEFPLYDVGERVPLRLIERPLVVMECSVTSPEYLGLGLGALALRAITSLKDTCRRFSGDFTMLWHNDELAMKEQRQLYTTVLDH